MSNGMDLSNIAVVADDKLRKYAIKLVHAISKNEGFKSSFFTPPKFKSNEAQITGRNRVIFIGKNKVSDAYIELINEKYEKHGVVWGYDGPKAAIYIKNEDLDIAGMETEISNIYQSTIAVGGTLTVGSSILGTLFAFNPVFWLAGIVYGIVKGVKKLISHFRRKNTAKDLQYKLGITSFLQQGFDDYIKG
jgi:hypothetical protein